MEKRWKTVKDFIFMGSKIIVDGDFSHEIKTPLLLGKTAMTNLDSMLKSRDITLLTKVYTVKSESESEVVSNCLRSCGLAAHQAPPSMGFSGQEYWSGLPFPSPGDLPNPGIEPRSPMLRADSLPSEPPGKPTQVAYNPTVLLTHRKLRPEQ